MGFNSAKLSCVRQFNFASLIRLQKTAYPARAEAEMTAAIASAGHEMKIDLKAHLDEIRWLVAGLSALNPLATDLRMPHRRYPIWPAIASPEGRCFEPVPHEL